MRLSESFSRCDRRRFARSHWLVGSLGPLLFGTGCPQLLDDGFSERDSELSLADPLAGGSGGGGGGSAGSSGTGGTSSGMGGTGGSTGSGGSAGGAGAAGAAGSGGAAGTGGIAELRSCPFGEPEAIVGLDFASGSEWGASLSADGLTLYFAQTASGAGDLYRATRPDRGVTFSAPVALTGLNTDDDDGAPFISADGLRLYFHSNRPGGPGGKDLYVATRSSVTAEFTSAELLGSVNSADLDHLARLSPDELTLWFTSTREGGPGSADLWTASRASIDTPFGTPTVLDAINGSSGDESGAVTQDGLLLVFDSTRDDNGNSEIFTATRASVDQAFAAPTHLSEVNSTENEYNVFMTLDERELFFSSNRNSPARHHLFRSLRSCD